MLDKFQKLFGPDASIGTAAVPPGEAGPERTQRTFVRLRRRIVGLAVIITACLVILPGFFEKNEDLTRQSAETAIPPVTARPEAARLALDNATSPAAAHENPEVALTRSSVKSGESAAASSLSLDNRVALNEKPMPKEDDDGTAVKKKAAEAKAAAAAKAEKEAKAKAAREAKAKAEKEAREKAAKEKAAKEAKEKALAGQKAQAEKKEKAAAAGGPYYIQVVAASRKETADRYSARVRNAGLPVYIEKAKGQDGRDIYRVRAGVFRTMKEAKSALDTLALNSITNGGIRSAGK